MNRESEPHPKFFGCGSGSSIFNFSAPAPAPAATPTQPQNTNINFFQIFWSENFLTFCISNFVIKWHNKLLTKNNMFGNLPNAIFINFFVESVNIFEDLGCFTWSRSRSKNFSSGSTWKPLGSNSLQILIGMFKIPQNQMLSRNVTGSTYILTCLAQYKLIDFDALLNHPLPRGKYRNWANDIQCFDVWSFKPASEWPLWGPE